MNRRIENLWWQGVETWYNSRDYMAAMDLWLQAVDEMDPSTTEFDLDALARHCDTCHDSTRETSHVTATATLTGTITGSIEVAEWLLFVAGCCLDAQRSHDARRCLGLCLVVAKSWSASNQSDANQQQRVSDLHTRALQEFMSSYQEQTDDSTTTLSPWRLAQRVVALTLDNTAGTVQTPWTNVYQRPAFWWQPLPLPRSVPNNGPAVWPVDKHPAWCRTLQDHAATIRDELQQLLSHNGAEIMPYSWPRVGAGDHRGGAGHEDGTVVRGLGATNTAPTTGDWRELVLFGSGARPDMAPRTAALIRTHCTEDVVSLADAGAGEVILSVLGPSTHIAPHTASHNVRATAHLGLVIPTIQSPPPLPAVSDAIPAGACYIRVADQICHWEPGRMLVFDDSFEHEVINSTSEIRVVLLMRFWHPSIPRSQRTAALARIHAAQQDDVIRRCNPPVPKNPSTIKMTAAWRARYRSETVCPSCWQSGYETIRVQPCDEQNDFGVDTHSPEEEQQRRFSCECGQPIA